MGLLRSQGMVRDPKAGSTRSRLEGWREGLCYQSSGSPTMGGAIVRCSSYQRYCLTGHRGLRIWEDTTESLGSRAEYQSRKLHRESCRGSPQVFSWVLIHTRMWGNYQRPGKEPPERIRGNTLQSSHKTLHELECPLHSKPPAVPPPAQWLSILAAH